ncbi:hypothetical protein O6H91_15G057700 [Diphasiastrum complanatum]|uniref:Uncharacterized protein n=1 Tax=Diphasiastrum complanatum TaxID=34168 RepID=A0ACC2BIL5_DIPCM|nr:hypothetical protein O6H91_15G057700 [Diphasiastrum complanatum]
MAHSGTFGSNGKQIVLDRSRVRILLCDKDPITAQEVLDLLRRCSYQVIEVLHDGDGEVDLILAEVELPNGKGLKMLKHIMKEDHLKRIPVVMMSARDEMATVVKCLRLGAADYLVKPLRINELLNLWTHMWRRRRMLGLSEKNLIGGNFNSNGVLRDFLVSDPSDSNTISTDLFSEDSVDKKFSVSVDGTSTLSRHKFQFDVSPVLELSLKPSTEKSEAPQVCCPRELPLKKIELKIGQSSAFLTYTKALNQSNGITQIHSSNVLTASVATNSTPIKKQELKDGLMIPPSITSHTNCANQQTEQSLATADLCMTPLDQCWEKTSTLVEKHQKEQFLPSAEISCGALEPVPELDNQAARKLEKQKRSSSCWGNAPLPADSSVGAANNQDLFLMMPNSAQAQLCPGIPVIPSLSHSCYLPQGLVPPLLHAPSLFQPAVHLYPGLQATVLSNAPGPPLHTFPSVHGLHAPSNVSYYPVALPVASGQFALTPMWPLLPNVTGNDCKPGLAERRKAALSKFRKKRKDRCFEKKIRYASRKRLAEQRPRIKGQFVRQLNDPELSGSGDEDFEDEDDDAGFFGMEADLSPEIEVEVAR